IGPCVREARSEMMQFWKSANEAVDYLLRLECALTGPVRAGWRRAGRGGLHCPVCRRLFIPEQRPKGMCELPHHACTIRRVAEGKPSCGGHVQRLPRPP